MTAGIVGLGLIGGSFVKAYHEAGVRVLAWNRSGTTTDYALACGEVDAVLTNDNMQECDIILICVYPEAAAEYLERMAPFIRKDAVVVDACGTKKKVCNLCRPIAKKYGIQYIGGHPMAGTHKSGYKYAKSTMFRNAPMVLVPDGNGQADLIQRAEELLAPVGFGVFSVTSAEAHDKMIAFTSQMPHIISNAYIKSPSSLAHRGFSAGSYKDLTRVAWLEPKLWSELFLENKENVLSELDYFINSLQMYRKAIDTEDKDELMRLLEEGRRRKAEVDGK